MDVTIYFHYHPNRSLKTSLKRVYVLCARVTPKTRTYVATATIFDLCQRQSWVSRVLSCVELLYVRYALEQDVSMYDVCVKSDYVSKVTSSFHHTFRDVTLQIEKEEINYLYNLN
jgi:hypothetical protein